MNNITRALLETVGFRPLLHSNAMCRHVFDPSLHRPRHVAFCVDALGPSMFPGLRRAQHITQLAVVASR